MLPEMRIALQSQQSGSGMLGCIGNQKSRVFVMDEFGNATRHGSNNRDHTAGHRFQQSQRQPFEGGHEQNRLALLQQRRYFFRWQTAEKANPIRQPGLMDLSLAGLPLRAIADQIGFDLSAGMAGVDQGAYHLVDAFLMLHQAAAVNDTKWLIGKSCLRWGRLDAIGNDGWAADRYSALKGIS